MTSPSPGCVALVLCLNFFCYVLANTSDISKSGAKEIRLRLHDLKQENFHRSIDGDSETNTQTSIANIPISGVPESSDSTPNQTSTSSPAILVLGKNTSQTRMPEGNVSTVAESKPTHKNLFSTPQTTQANLRSNTTQTQLLVERFRNILSRINEIIPDEDLFSTPKTIRANLQSNTTQTQLLNERFRNILSRINEIIPGEDQQQALQYVFNSGLLGNSTLYSTIQDFIGTFNTQYISKDMLASMEQMLPSFLSALAKIGPDHSTKDKQNMLALVSLLPLLKNIGKATDIGKVSGLASLLNGILDFKQPDLHNLTEPLCQTGLKAYINALFNKEDWAIKMFDATGKPTAGIMEGATSWIGHFDECLQIQHTITDENSTSISGSYCIVKVSTPEFLMPTLPSNQNVKIPSLRIDMCFPDVCPNTDLKTVLTKRFSAFDIHLVSVECMKYREPIREDNQAVVAVCVLSVIGLLTLCAMVVRLNGSNEERKHDDILPTTTNDSVMMTEKTEYQNENVIAAKHSVTDTEDAEVKSRAFPAAETAEKILMSFNVQDNLRKILDVSTDSSYLGCLSGIRVLTMFYIILGHTHVFCVLSSLFVNRRIVADWSVDFWHEPILNNSLAVDTFFLISGTLVCYLFLLETKKRGGLNIKQIIYFYIHRYWRLTPLYGLAFMIYLCILPHFIDGPEKTSPIADSTNCKNVWWTYFLYMNNAYRTEETEMCMAWTWYIAVDMQLFVISPLVLIPLVLFKWIGFALIAVLIAIHIISNAILQQKYPGNLLSMSQATQQNWFTEVYQKPYARVGPYAIGLLLGYALYSNIKRKLKLKQKLVVCLWLLSACLILVVTYVTYDMSHNPWTTLQKTAFDSTKRLVWATAVGWIIFACSSGYGGFVNQILCWKAWTPLSRITYAAYLFHPMVMIYYYFSAKSTAYVDERSIAFDFVSFAAISYGIALVATVFLEAPWVVLEKILRRKLSFVK